MKPAPFNLATARTTDEAVAALVRYADARLLAGGQSLVPMMNFRLVRPAWLIDINRVDELKGIERRDDRVTIGSMTRHVELERSSLLQQYVPLISEAVPYIGHTAIRNRGTIGGSISHADPAAELPVVLMALDAVMHVRGARGARTIASEDFFVSLFTTAIAADEILTAVEVPTIAPSEGCAFTEFARRHGDFALAAVAVRLRIDVGRIAGPVRISLGGVAECATRARGTEAMLLGATPAPELLDAAADQVALEIDPPADIHGSSAYRKNLVRVSVKAALAQAVVRAGQDRRLGA
jgi:aerobic carbon-monoxide dehydrogenase medium subunit